LKENDPEHTSGAFDLTSHGDAKFRGCRDDCHVPKNDLHQPGNRGIALIGTSPHLTETVSKANPPLHTHNRQRAALLGYSQVCLASTSRIIHFKKKKLNCLEKSTSPIFKVMHVRQETFFALRRFRANSPNFLPISGICRAVLAGFYPGGFPPA
jgi:hypothetical protein